MLQRISLIALIVSAFSQEGAASRETKTAYRNFSSNREHSPHLSEFSRTGDTESQNFWKYVDQQSVNLFGMDVETPGAEPILVTVGEKHNGVLPHWIGLAHSGTLKKSGVTILHIDTHSDLMLPVVTLGSGWPWDGYSLMQQSNIATFIVAAAQVGLVDHVIWLRPVWKENVKLWNFPQVFGTYNVRIGQSKGMLLCYFKENDLQLDGDSCEEDDMFLFNFMLTVAPLNGTVLSDITNHYQVAHPTLANWRSSEIILDIDLDFFSCVDSTLTTTMRTTGIENSVYKKIRAAAIDLNDECCGKKTAAKRLAFDIARLLSRSNNTLEERKDLCKRNRPAWCKRNAALESLNELNFHMAPLSDWQRWSILLNLLNLEGEAHEMRSPLPFGNIHLVEPEHLSTQAELDEVFAKLKMALQDIRPTVISVTRSIWDGYLPLDLWPQIERATFSTLVDLYQSIRVRWDRALAPPPGILEHFHP